MTGAERELRESLEDRHILDADLHREEQEPRARLRDVCRRRLQNLKAIEDIHAQLEEAVRA